MFTLLVTSKLPIQVIDQSSAYSILCDLLWQGPEGDRESCMKKFKTPALKFIFNSVLVNQGAVAEPRGTAALCFHLVISAYRSSRVKRKRLTSAPARQTDCSTQYIAWLTVWSHDDIQKQIRGLARLAADRRNQSLFWLLNFTLRLASSHVNIRRHIRCWWSIFTWWD